MSNIANQAASLSTSTFPSFQLSSHDSIVTVENNSGSAATLRSTRGGGAVISVKGLKLSYFLIYFSCAVL